jgi:opine dehydrogenase
MKIAVLGSGNGGCAMPFDRAHHGHDVTLFDLLTSLTTLRPSRRRSTMPS